MHYEPVDQITPPSKASFEPAEPLHAPEYFMGAPTWKKVISCIPVFGKFISDNQQADLLKQFVKIDDKDLKSYILDEDAKFELASLIRNVLTLKTLFSAVSWALFKRLIGNAARNVILSVGSVVLMGAVGKNIKHLWDVRNQIRKIEGQPDANI